MLAALNHDDDLLALGLYQQGALVMEYESGRFLGSVRALCRAFDRPLATPMVWLILRMIHPAFESMRHAWLASALGLPRWTVGSGYNYVARGEPPPGLSLADLLFVDPHR